MTRKELMAKATDEKKLKLVKQDIKIMCMCIPVVDNIKFARFDKMIQHVYKHTLNNPKLKLNEAITWAATLYWICRDYDDKLLNRCMLSIYKYDVSEVDEKLYGELGEMLCYGMENKFDKTVRHLASIFKKGE